MKTFVAEGVLTDYTSGMVVVKASNLKKAIDIVRKNFDYSADEICESLREMENNELVYVYGGRMR